MRLLVITPDYLSHTMPMLTIADACSVTVNPTRIPATSMRCTLSRAVTVTMPLKPLSVAPIESRYRCSRTLYAA